MKCRIIKKGTKFYAQYLVKKTCKGGKFSRQLDKWKTLKRMICDQRDGNYEVDWFETEKSVVDALIKFAEENSEGKVVKEFEL